LAGRLPAHISTRLRPPHRSIRLLTAIDANDGPVASNVRDPDPRRPGDASCRSYVALERRAASEGVSKAAIIRRTVRAELPTTVPLAADPLSRMVGADSFEPDDIDDVVYR